MSLISVTASATPMQSMVGPYRKAKVVNDDSSARTTVPEVEKPKKAVMQIALSNLAQGRKAIEKNTRIEKSTRNVDSR